MRGAARKGGPYRDRCCLGGVRVSVCLSAIGVRLPTLQECPGQVRDQVGLFVESEVAGVDDVHLGVWHVPAVCLGLLDLERGVVAAPYDLQGWLVFAEPVLPGG